MRTERTLVCKCGEKVVVLSTTARVWHQTCPQRGPRAAAPEYVKVRAR